MSLVRRVRCRVHLHHWGPVTGDDRGAHRTCEHCGARKRLPDLQPPEAHDMMGLHH